MKSSHFFFFAKNVTIQEFQRHSDGYIEGQALFNNNVFPFEIKRYEQDGDGINQGRISKMVIEKDHSIVSINYDRAWYNHWRKAPKDLQAVYRAILKKYN